MSESCHDLQAARIRRGSFNAPAPGLQKKLGQTRPVKCSLNGHSLPFKIHKGLTRSAWPEMRGACQRVFPFPTLSPK